jgi:NADPH-dependent 2,4-dienoyl-CoA reductase/sulfur reductase-like enzyme
VVFDRGPYVAFANCGLPYYVGDVIADERTLLVASPEMFRERFNIEVHTSTEVVDINRPERTLSVRDLQSGESRTERYDALVLSPGAAPIRPQLPGVDLPGVLSASVLRDRISAPARISIAEFVWRVYDVCGIQRGWPDPLTASLNHERCAVADGLQFQRSRRDPAGGAAMAGGRRAAGVGLFLRGLPTAARRDPAAAGEGY